MTNLAKRLKELPKTPGVYLMRDAKGAILYAGKATNLRARVRTHFHGKDTGFKNNFLMEQVRGLDYIPTPGPQEALLLENSIIKKFQPKYNVLFRDDKRYPMLKLTLSEDFPRLLIVRRKTMKRGEKARYFGPFPDASSMRNSLRLARKIFPLRVCKLNIQEGVVTDFNRKYAKNCLYYHLKRCPAPCVAEIDKKGYARIVSDVEMFLSGKRMEVLEDLKGRMKKAVRALAFEQAAHQRDQISAIENMLTRIRFWRISEEDMVVRKAPDTLLGELKRLLGLPGLPRRIEGFDISNLGPKEAVGSMVTFLEARPHPAHYRKFRIRTLSGQDDFGMIREVLTRRYGGDLARELPLPDLILIDGGKGHLSSAKSVLRKLGLEIPCIALAKENEEIYLDATGAPLCLPYNSPALKLLQHVRDEAHRFAILYHRKLRAKNLLEKS